MCGAANKRSILYAFFMNFLFFSLCLLSMRGPMKPSICTIVNIHSASLWNKFQIPNHVQLSSKQARHIVFKLPTVLNPYSRNSTWSVIDRDVDPSCNCFFSVSCARLQVCYILVSIMSYLCHKFANFNECFCTNYHNVVD